MENKVTLSKKEFTNVFIRSNFISGSFNFERMHNLGFAFQMIPVIEKFYDTKEEKAEALKRHLEFYNTHPYVTAPILGVTVAMEEEKANGGDLSDGAINGIKVGMMGPLAGVGDPIFWGTMRPVLAALGAGLAIEGSLMGPLVFFLVFNILRLSFRYFGLKIGYEKGMSLVSDMGGTVLNKLTEGASILGLFIMGVLISRWTTIYFPTVVSKITQQDGKVQITTIQNILDSLMPGIIPLALTFLAMYLLRKKMSPIVLIFLLFAVGIIGYGIGLLGFPS